MGRTSTARALMLARTLWALAFVLLISSFFVGQIDGVTDDHVDIIMTQLALLASTGAAVASISVMLSHAAARVVNALLSLLDDPTAADMITERDLDNFDQLSRQRRRHEPDADESRRDDNA